MGISSKGSFALVGFPQQGQKTLFFDSYVVSSAHWNANERLWVFNKNRNPRAFDYLQNSFPWA